MTLILNDRLMQDLAWPTLVFSDNSSIYNYTYTLPLASKYYFYLKVAFISFLFIINIWIVISSPGKNNEITYMQSTLGNFNKNLKELSQIFIGITGALAAFSNLKVNASQEERERRQTALQNQIERAKKVDLDKDSISSTVKENKSTLIELNTDIQKAKAYSLDTKAELNQMEIHIGKYRALFKAHDEALNERDRTKLLGEIDQCKVDLSKAWDNSQKNLNSAQDLVDNAIEKSNKVLDSHIELSKNISSSSGKGNIASSSQSEQEKELIKEEDIQKSSIFNFDIESFNKLSVIKQICVTLLFTNSVIISALVTIIYIHYGEILIEKFNLNEKYPKISKIIEYRKKFSKFYFFTSCLYIFIVAIIHISFSVAVLSL